MHGEFAGDNRQVVCSNELGHTKATRPCLLEMSAAWASPIYSVFQQFNEMCRIGVTKKCRSSGMHILLVHVTWAIPNPLKANKSRYSLTWRLGKHTQDCVTFGQKWKEDRTSRKSSGNVSTCRGLYLHKRDCQCVPSFSVVAAIGDLPFSATEAGSMKHKMEGKNRVHKKWGKSRKGRGWLSDYLDTWGCSQGEKQGN